MGSAYTIKDQGAVHFVTFTVHQWADVFTRPKYVDIFIESLKYCQQGKGLEIYAWVFMSNHCHLIIRSTSHPLSNVIRDLKKFTAKAIFKAIATNKQESRKEWILQVLSYQDKTWFWKEGYHGDEVYSDSFYESKVQYIHQNPVKAGIVQEGDAYLLSSAADFAGTRKGRLQLSIFE